MFRKKRKEEKDNQQGDQIQDPISIDLERNIHGLRTIYEDCSDVVFRHFLINGAIEAYLIYIEGLSNEQEINDHVLIPLMKESTEQPNTCNLWIQKKLTISNVKPISTFNNCIQHISMGNPVLLINKEKHGFALSLAKSEKRSVEEPSSESTVRGPRDGFTESIGTNTSLLRRKLRSPKLKMKSMQLGTYTLTNVMIAYIEGIVDKTLVEEVRNRLERVCIDGILESGYIEEMIEDNPLSPFPQVMTTERPDVCAAALLEGRVAILVDGTPFIMIVPTTLYSLLQSSEDYYQRFMIGTVIRWLRYVFLVISLLLPSVYVAALTFHQEMIPTKLMLSVAASREAVPFPALIEALIMEIVFEALREAGIRLPKQVGSAVSIVGALVIGQAAVEAGLVSAPMVMVVAITGIASFTIPRYSAGIALRLARFPMIFLAGTLGFLGILLGLMALLAHLCTLRSFGVPYLSPMAPMNVSSMKDVLVRAPWWSLRKRPHLTGEYNQYRQPPVQQASPLHKQDQNGDKKR